jgi:ribosomal protein S27AE
LDNETDMKVKLYLKNGLCPRCGLDLVQFKNKFTENKKVPCPYCGAFAIRVKMPRYTESLSEKFACTNMECRVTFVILSKRENVKQI